MKKFFIIFALFLLFSCGQQNSISDNLSGSGENLIQNETNISDTKENQGQKENNVVSLITENNEKICAKEICIDLTKPNFLVEDEILQFVIIQKSDNPSTGEVVETIVSYLDALPPKEKNTEQYMIDLHENEEYVSKQIFINKKNGIAKEIEEEFFGESTKTIVQKGQLIIENTEILACGGASHEQKFYLSETGKEIIDPSGFIDYPKEIGVGNFRLKIDWNWWENENHGSGLKYGDENTEESVTYIGELSLQKNLEEQLLKALEEDKKWGTYGYYKLTFKEIPGIIFVYKNTKIPAFGIMKNDFTPDMIDEKGNLINLEKTKQIAEMQGYRENMDENFFMNLRIKPKNSDDFDYKNIKSEEITKEMLPIYNIEEINNDLVLLRTTAQYEAYSTAELCKPLIYVYDDKNQSNSVKIQFPKGGDFTKILPDFTGINSWDFVADMKSTLLVGGQKNPENYLYYSARVPYYEFNKNGWQVYGRDIEKFFNEKLDVIGFNAQEKSDFIDYWKTEFDAEKLYFVSFKFDEDIDKYVTLNFDKKPNAQMRVLLEAYLIKYENAKFLYPNVGSKFDKFLLKKFVRSGVFDVFEWGGVMQKDFSGNIIIR